MGRGKGTGFVGRKMSAAAMSISSANAGALFSTATAAPSAATGRLKFLQKTPPAQVGTEHLPQWEAMVVGQIT